MTCNGHATHRWFGFGRFSALVVSVMLVIAPAQANPAAALPPGPKKNLAQWVEGDTATLEAVVAKDLDAQAWQAELQGIEPSEALAALADYLSLNLPAEPAGSDVASMLAGLPADGKELYLRDCLSCHGGDRYFLQQDNSIDEWMGIFDAPYHRRLLTEGLERETFASYAAHTVPLTLETVPEELQDRAD